MEFSLSGNALKTFARSITCLARVGNELVFQCSPSQFSLHTLNSSRSAYQSITFKPEFFDAYTVSDAQVQCSVLLKATCSVLRTPIASIDHLTVQLANPVASKFQWTLDCFSGIKKAYWITCNVEPDIQHLLLDRRKLPSSLVVKPRDLNRLLANFQSNLQEITIIATQTFAVPPGAADQIGGKAVELRSYIDPTKCKLGMCLISSNKFSLQLNLRLNLLIPENDSSLHTQLWIDPNEEFVQYTHSRDPVDVTFGVKELKAFISYCEGCEVDVHLYFDKAGEPILMAPKFGLDDAFSGNFDATLVLATMLVSQLNGGNSFEPPQAVATGAPPQHGTKGNTSEHPSDHTRIWSELSASAAKDGKGAERQVHMERNQDANNEQRTTIQRVGAMNISTDKNADGMPGSSDCHTMETDDPGQPQVINGHTVSQHHPSNWIDANEDDDEGDDETELCVQSTPPYS